MVKTSSRLRLGQWCPLHRAYVCCGREKPTKKSSKHVSVNGVTRIEDSFHPRGYREKCSPAVMTQRKHQLMARNPVCLYCGVNFLDDKTAYSDIHLAHKESKGMNGAKRDDHLSNLGLAHARENVVNGSRKVA